MELTWRTNILVGCLHAADLVRRHVPLRDRALQQALEEPTDVITRALEEERLPAEIFWQAVVPLSAEFDSPRRLAEVVLTKLQGSLEATMRIPRFERHLHALRLAFQRVQGNAAGTLPALARTVQQRWNVQGSGLLAGVPGWTDPEILVEAATVLVVPPFAGGAGTAHLPYNSVRIEAAEDADPEVPEPLRLAWLLAQLNLDVPRFSEDIARERLALVAGLAMAPVLIAVAENIRLITRADDTLERAIRLWMPSDRADRLVTTVSQWWETYSGRRPSWSAALQALDQLLQE
jgi:hypothetical protein